MWLLGLVPGTSGTDTIRQAATKKKVPTQTKIPSIPHLVKIKKTFQLSHVCCAAMNRVVSRNVLLLREMRCLAANWDGSKFQGTHVQMGQNLWYILIPYGGWLRNPNHQLIGGKHPIVYRFSTIQGDAGFLPSTVCWPSAHCLHAHYQMQIEWLHSPR